MRPRCPFPIGETKSIILVAKSFGVFSFSSVILSSGYSIEGQAESILKKGCDGFIQKPYNLNQLARKIKDILA